MTFFGVFMSVCTKIGTLCDLEFVSGFAGFANSLSYRDIRAAIFCRMSALANYATSVVGIAQELTPLGWSMLLAESAVRSGSAELSP